MSEHTPGPWNWVVHDHSLASLGPGRDPGLGDPLVLATGPCSGCAERAEPKEWKWGRCQTPSLANARLIAAAPELLEALESMLSEFVGPYEGGFDSVVKARAAIAKATGAA